MLISCYTTKKHTILVNVAFISDVADLDAADLVQHIVDDGSAVAAAAAVVVVAAVAEHHVLRWRSAGSSEDIVGEGCVVAVDVYGHQHLHGEMLHQHMN